MPVIKISHAGPDDPIYKGGLRVSAVLGPSALRKEPQSSATEATPDPAPADDPMLPAMNGIEDWLRREAAKYEAMERDEPGSAAPPPQDEGKQG